MKKSFREWVFNLFTKRITIKVANLPNDAKIEYLVNKLMNELVAQGHSIKGTGEMNEHLNLFCHGGKVEIASNTSPSLWVKRLSKV